MHNIKQLQTHKHAFIWLSWDFYYIQSSSKERGARAHTHTRASILFYWLLHVHLPHVFSCMWGLCVFAFVYCKSVHSLCPLTPVLAFSWGFRPGSSCRFCPRLLCLTSSGSGTHQQLAAKPTCRFLCCQRHNERQKTWTKEFCAKWQNSHPPLLLILNECWYSSVIVSVVVLLTGWARGHKAWAGWVWKRISLHGCS